MRKAIVMPIAVVLLMLVIWTIYSRGNIETEQFFVNPESGEFNVTVTASGELRAKNSLQVMGPRGVRDVRIFQLRIIDMVPEGTLVNQGDYVAQLDLTDLHTRLQAAEVEVQRVLSQYEQAELDSSLTLTQARYDLENLELQLEERQLAVEQSVYESPAVQRQTQIELERTVRQLEQGRVNYVTRKQQSEARLREIEAELQSEQNLLQRLKAFEDEFTIRAPMDGMIVYHRDRRGRRTTVESTINVQNPIIAELPDFGAMESITYINEVDIKQIEPGQKVNIGLDADRDKQLTGEVVSVANIGEQRSGTDARVFEVVVSINEFDPDLRPTMTTYNKVEVHSVADAIYVPLETIHLKDNNHFVYKKNGSELVLQQVLLGATNDTQVVILSGLDESDDILLSMPPDSEELNRILVATEIMDQYGDDILPE